MRIQSAILATSDRFDNAGDRNQLELFTFFDRTTVTARTRIKLCITVHPRIDRMLCWSRIRRWSASNNCRHTADSLRAGRDGAACVVVVAVQNTCGKASCRAGSVGTDEEDPIMTIPPGLEAQILRYYHVQKWRNGGRRPPPPGAGDLAGHGIALCLQIRAILSGRTVPQPVDIY
jgi:hypothetical protein